MLGNCLDDDFDDGPIHVIPLDDLREHEESDKCPCEPTIQWVRGTKIVIHGSYDKREYIENWEEATKRDE